jgi:CRP-like cAMP-binding protein
MAKDPKLDRLHAAPLFAACDKKELSRLAMAIDLIDIEAGKTLIRQGTVNHEAFVIESGEADVFIDDELVATIPAGEMVGEIGLLTRSPASATVVAKSDMSVLMIPHQRFDAIATDTPGLGWAIAKELAHRLQATDASLH